MKEGAIMQNNNVVLHVRMDQNEPDAMPSGVLAGPA